MAEKKKKNGSFWKTPVGIIVFSLLFAVVLLAIIIGSEKLKHRIDGDPEATTTASTDAENLGGEQTEATEATTAWDKVRSDIIWEYENGKTLSVDLTEKVTLTIGLEEHSYRDGLVINADVKYRWDDAGYDDPYYYGIVFTPSSGSMWYSRVNDDRIWGVASAECNRNYQTQYVAGRTFDMCVPAPYLNSTDFGAMWVWTRSIYESPTPKTMQLHMNVIRLPDGTDGMGRPNGDGTLLGVAVVDIVPDLEHGTFSFQNLRSNESVTAGDLTAEQRNTVIEEAMAFAYQGNNSWFGIAENDISYEHNIIVERVNDTYYDIKFNTKGDVINRNWLPDCDKMYAVNIPLKGMGYLTIYVTEKNGSYAAAAYDALCPLSIEDIANYMDESDFIAFGLNFYG